MTNSNSMKNQVCLFERLTYHVTFYFQLPLTNWTPTAVHSTLKYCSDSGTIRPSERVLEGILLHCHQIWSGFARDVSWGLCRTDGNIFDAIDNVETYKRYMGTQPLTRVPLFQKYELFVLFWRQNSIGDGSNYIATSIREHESPPRSCQMGFYLRFSLGESPLSLHISIHSLSCSPSQIWFILFS